MNETLSSLINSKILSDRKKAVSSFISTPEWFENRSLVMRFLRDKEKNIRADISDALCQVDPVKVEVELRYIAQSEDEDLKSNALNALTKFKSHSNITLLIQAIPKADSELEETIKSNLIEMLQEDQPAVLKHVFESFSDEDESVRDAALGIFAKANDKASSIQSFLKYLQSVSPSIRETIYEVAKKKVILFASLCTQSLKVETNPNLKIQALSILKHFEDNAIEDLLLREINSDDWMLQRFVMTTLGEMQSEKSKDAIITLLDNPKRVVDSIAALKKYNDPQMGAVFINKLGKVNEEIQVVLLNAIEKYAITDERYIEPLLTFADHEISCEEAKLSSIKIVEKICRQTSTQIPEQVALIKNQINKEKKAGIPDLGLKLLKE